MEVFMEKFTTIPNFTKYAISDKGNVINIESKVMINPNMGNSGYKQVTINRDDGVRTTIGIHRLMCIVFKPIKHPEKFQVNHINGNKFDNSLANLEWVTPRDNVLHAGFNKLSEKCKAVDVKNVITDEIKTYNSFTECGEAFGISKDSVSDRVKKPSKLYDKKYLFRLHSVSPWPQIPDDKIEYARKTPVISNIVRDKRKERAQIPVQILNRLTNEIKTFDSLSDLAQYLNVKNGTLSRWLSNNEQPIVKGYNQIKLLSDTNDWDMKDPYFGLMNTTGHIPVESVQVNKRIVYTSISEAAKRNNCTPNEMYNKVRSNGKILYNDGKRYGYYPCFVNLSIHNE